MPTAFRPAIAAAVLVHPLGGLLRETATTAGRQAHGYPGHLPWVRAGEGWAYVDAYDDFLFDNASSAARFGSPFRPQENPVCRRGSVPDLVQGRRGAHGMALLQEQERGQRSLGDDEIPGQRSWRRQLLAGGQTVQNLRTKPLQGCAATRRSTMNTRGSTGRSTTAWSTAGSA